MFVQIQNITFNTDLIQKIHTTDCENAFRLIITAGPETVLNFTNRPERDAVANKLYSQLKVHQYSVKAVEIEVEEKEDQ
jgi:hypothetical protein